MTPLETQTQSLKDKKCLYCGNNPTSHFQSRVDSSLYLLINPISQKLYRTIIGTFFFSITDHILNIMIWSGLVLGCIRFDVDISSIKSDRGRVLADEAVMRGWKMEVMRIFGKVVDAYRITFPNGKRFDFRGIPRVGVAADMAAGWIDDKALLKTCLAAAKVTVSKGTAVIRMKEAERVFHSLQKPVIVKPRLGSRGRHTTTNLEHIDDFRKAFVIAKQLGRSVIVEEHLVGSVYRATMIDGVLAGVLAGDPPRITGDGVHTISELIDIKNKNRHERVGEVKVTNRMIEFLGRQNYSLESILTDGITIDLSEKIGLSYGGHSKEVTPSVHPKLRKELERAAHAVDDPLLGFDFITTDVSIDPDTVRWGIIECNSVPFINLHHDPLEGEPINVAKLVLDYLERELSRA